MLTITTFVIIQSVLGADYCSSKNGQRVECFPCSGGCSLKNSSCDTSTYAFCPNECGNSIPANECLEICGDTCRDGRCKYSKDRVTMCTGCKSRFTGQTCKEFCPSECHECDQYNLKCITCKGNFLPPNCSEAKLEMFTSMPKISNCSETTSVITTSALKLNCSLKCRNCNDLSGDCTECINGTYGGNCQNTCTHCNISLCGLDMECSDCISNLSSIECPAMKDNKINHRFPELWPLICGIAAVLFLMVGFIGIWRKLSSRYRLQCKFIAVHDGNSNSGPTLAANQGYVYIDDNALDPYYSGFNNSRTRPRQCPANNHYECVEHKDAYQDVENGSSLSSISETIFGNLFEVNTKYHERDECKFSEGQPNLDEDKDYESVEDYEMYSLSYLTPDSPAPCTSSDNL